MGTGYTRADVSNNIADGNIINASDIDSEYDAIEAAFNSSTGHTHDGTSAEGGPITVLGPVQDFVASATEIKPKTTNTLDIGTSGLQFKDLYLDGTAYLDDVQAVGAVDITGDLDVDNININGNTISSTNTNGNITLAPNGTGVVALSSTDLTFGDNDKAIFGAGSDLLIYHDGSNSYIADAGTGNLNISGTNLNLQTATGENYIRCTQDGAVDIRYDNATKLATTSGGIDVTGTVTADGLTVGSTGVLTLGEEAVTSGYLNAPESLYVNIDSNNNDVSSKFQIGTNATGIATNVKFTVVDNGDISFYDSTGVTQGFFWDASTQALGLGTTSTDSVTPIRINKSDSSAGYIRFTNSDATSGFYVGLTANEDAIFNNQESSDMYFNTSNTTRMTITSGGSVGIGTTSPRGRLDVTNSDSANGTKIISEVTSTNISASNNASFSLYEIGTEYGRFQRARDGSGTVKLTAFGTQHLSLETLGAGEMYFKTNNTEAARIDSSQNLLVGTASTDETTVGVRAFSLGKISATRDGGRPAEFNRLSSDGTIAEFRKDGTTVGSIGSRSGVVSYITLDPRGSVKGASLVGGSVDVNTGVINPGKNDGDVADDAINIGSSSYRFKDLYLSGGVYLGGTGASNLLSDYEEGIHTASLTPTTSGSITLSQDALAYTKVGRVVHLQGRLVVSSVSSPTGLIALSLPFAIANTTEDSARTVGYLQIQNATSNLNEFGFYATESGSSINLIVTGGNTSETTGANAMAAELSGDELLAINLTYITT